MSDLLHDVKQDIQARRLFRPGQRILVAVSGGIDSVVLLHLLHGLSQKNQWRLTVAHFNHRLRGRSSDADERLVRRMATSLKLPVVVEAADVRESARAQRVSLEMAARRLRHDFLARAARRRHNPGIALAHHADDQLELFFLRLLRGSGGEGLAGMKWRNPSPSDAQIDLVRPLLDQPKQALREYAAEHRIPHREDRTNALLDFRRNRIRHELLPLLRTKYQPALDKVVPRLMEIVGAEAEFAAQAAGEWLAGGRNPKAEVRTPKSESGAASSAWRRDAQERDRRRQPFDSLPPAVQRRCVQLQLIGEGVVPDFELVEELRLSPGRQVAIRLPGTPFGAEKDRAGDWLMGAAALPVRHYATRDPSGVVLVQAAAWQEFKREVAEVALEGRAGEVEFDRTRISWRIHSRKGPTRARVELGGECFDADKVGPLVRLRHWQPGDRFQPIGMSCPVKLQDFFTNQRLPREQRRRLIVAATAQGEVFWVEGLRISERFKLTADTNRRLQWRWKRL